MNTSVYFKIVIKCKIQTSTLSVLKYFRGPWMFFKVQAFSRISQAHSEPCTILSRLCITDSDRQLCCYNLEYFDDTLFTVGDVDGLKHFAVFAASQLPDQLIIVLLTASYSHNMLLSQSAKRCTAAAATCYAPDRHAWVLKLKPYKT